MKTRKIVIILEIISLGIIGLLIAQRLTKTIEPEPTPEPPVIEEKAPEEEKACCKAKNTEQPKETIKAPEPKPEEAPKEQPQPIVVVVQTPPPQIINNPTPQTTMTTPTPEDNTPKEVPFETLAKYQVPNRGTDYVQITVTMAKKDDIAKLTLNEQTHTKIVEKDNGPSQLFEIRELTPATWYEYQIRVERGNEYAIKNDSFRTDLPE